MLKTVNAHKDPTISKEVGKKLAEKRKEITFHVTCSAKLGRGVDEIGRSGGTKQRGSTRCADCANAEGSEAQAILRQLSITVASAGENRIRDPESQEVSKLLLPQIQGLDAHDDGATTSLRDRSH